jgi:hypothetical protein
VSTNPILLSKECECGSQTGALGSSVGSVRFLCCARCNKPIKAVTKKELEALISSEGESVELPLRRRCLCGNKKGVGVPAGSQWVVRCLRCNIFSHFATESEVVRGGSPLPATKRRVEAKKGAAPKAIPLRGLVTALQPNPKGEKVVGVRAAPEALAPAPIQPRRTALLASLVALALEKPALVPPREAKTQLAPAIPVAEPFQESAKAELVKKVEPSTPLQHPWEEELVGEVEKELRLLALQRKVREVADTLTYRLRGL